MIPQRKVQDGQTVLFDARIDALTVQENKTLVKMLDGNGTFMTPEGTMFWVKHPYRWVTDADLAFVIGSREPSFRLATLNEVEDHYAY